MTEYSYPAFFEAVVRHRGSRSCWVEALLDARRSEFIRDRWKYGDAVPGWAAEAMRDAYRGCHGEFDAHHLVSKQRIKQKFHPDDDRRGDALMDPRGGVIACRHHHDLLERRLVVPRRDELPEDAVEFAAEIGMSWSVERDYPEAA